MQEHVRKPVNKGQVAVLMLLYQYRFLTADRIAQAQQQKHVRVVRSRLNILHEQGYIGRQFDSSYKLLGKSACYYLLPRGVNALKATAFTHPRAVKSTYNDKEASDAFIYSSLTIFDVSAQYKASHPEAVQTFTRSELAAYDYFPQPTPDIYVSIEGTQTKHYFVDLYTKDMPPFAILRRIKRYIAYAQSGAWDDTGSDLPGIVLICWSRRAENTLRERIIPLLADGDMDVQLHTTTLEEFMAASLPETVYRPL